MAKTATDSVVAPADKDGGGLTGLLRESAMAGGVALILTITMIGLQTASVNSRLVIQYRWAEVLVAVVMVALARFCLGLLRRGNRLPALIMGALSVGAGLYVHANLAGHKIPTTTDPALLPQFDRLPAVLGSGEAQAALLAGGVVLILGALLGYWRLWYRRMFDPETGLRYRAITIGGHDLAKLREAYGLKLAGAIGIVLAFIFPLFFSGDRYAIDLATLVLTYVMLGWGLNIVVGLAGLLDLGYVAFYAVGAYSYALLAIHFDLSFWLCLPLAGLFGATAGLLLGFPVLRLRGDYFAIVTLGFGEIIRIILINWKPITGGPDGLSDIPRPSFFGIAEFSRKASPDGLPTFHEMFGLDYSSIHRLIFLYYLILLLALLVNVVSLRIRKLPIGRSWEALREDDIACQALGINRRNIKLAAFAISATFGGLAGAFFATRQGFISPESFTFIESAIVLAIVVLGGMGSQTGVVLATFFVIFLPEYFRDLADYRMLMFGAAMVLIMVWRPRGLLSSREPTVRLHGRGSTRAEPAAVGEGAA